MLDSVKEDGDDVRCVANVVTGDLRHEKAVMAMESDHGETIDKGLAVKRELLKSEVKLTGQRWIFEIALRGKKDWRAGAERQRGVVLRADCVP